MEDSNKTESPLPDETSPKTSPKPTLGDQVESALSGVVKPSVSRTSRRFVGRFVVTDYQPVRVIRDGKLTEDEVLMEPGFEFSVLLLTRRSDMPDFVVVTLDLNERESGMARCPDEDYVLDSLDGEWTELPELPRAD
jgi:hypothetical protein